MPTGTAAYGLAFRLTHGSPPVTSSKAPYRPPTAAVSLHRLNTRGQLGDGAVCSATHCRSLHGAVKGMHVGLKAG